MSGDTEDLADVKNFVFDLDHTVWYWNRLAPGVKKTIRRLKAKNKRIFYLSDNSILTREETASKLTDLGIKTDEDRIIASTDVAAETFVSKGIEAVYAIGESGLVDTLEEHHIATKKDADHVVVGMDRNFSYWKLAKAAERVRDGATLWTLDRDPWFRAGDRIIPGTKALLHAITTASGAEEIHDLGKQSRYFFERVKDEFPVMPGNAVLIGDSLEADVMLGNKLGLKTGLVLSGQSDREDIKEVSGLTVPDFVFTSFDRILRKV